MFWSLCTELIQTPGLDKFISRRLVFRAPDRARQKTGERNQSACLSEQEKTKNIVFCNF